MTAIVIRENVKATWLPGMASVPARACGMVRRAVDYAAAAVMICAAGAALLQLAVQIASFPAPCRGHRVHADCGGLVPVAAPTPARARGSGTSASTASRHARCPLRACAAVSNWPMAGPARDDGAAGVAPQR
jgi:hypothetical protein